MKKRDKRYGGSLARNPGQIGHEKVREPLFIAATLTPALVILTVYVFFPTVYSIYLSVFKTRFFSPVTFVGVRHYVDIFQDPVFWTAVLNTSYYTVVSVVATLICGLGVALLLFGRLWGKTVFRAVYFIPYVMPYAAFALLWNWLYDPRYGLVDYLLSFLGIKPVPWLVSAHWVIPAFIMMNVWKRLGFAMVIFLAGMQTIPEELYDAATVDGMSSWKKLQYVTLPLLSPITVFITVISVIYGLQLFNEPFIMTKGGPAYGSISIAYLLYQESFSSLDVGTGSAIACVLFVLIFVPSIILMRRFDTGQLY